MNSATITINGKTNDVIIGEERIFSTGSRGYNSSCKIEINGKRYQVSLNIIEIGSKPKK